MKFDKTALNITNGKETLKIRKQILEWCRDNLVELEKSCKAKSHLQNRLRYSQERALQRLAYEDNNER